MDRLFRAEFEAEEEQRNAEMALDVTPFLGSPAEPEPEALIETAMETEKASMLSATASPRISHMDSKSTDPRFVEPF